MKKTFVIGTPISHSLSPKMHNFWLKKYKIEANYSAINITPKKLHSFINRLKEKKEFIGGNVTIPHKQNIIAYCDEISAEASEIGAINTLYINNKKIYGYNSDWLGFLANLDNEIIDWDKSPEQKQALIIGAGGASLAIIYALMRRNISQIHILNRTYINAINLSKQMSQYCFDNVKIIAHQFEQFEQLAPNIDILINTSSVGMNGTKFDNLALNKLPQKAIVNDIVYTPLKTPLLQEAQQLGLTTVDGLGMLLYQGVLGFEKWFGIKPEIDAELRNYMLSFLGEK